MGTAERTGGGGFLKRKTVYTWSCFLLTFEPEAAKTAACKKTQNRYVKTQKQIHTKRLRTDTNEKPLCRD
jgi:hypothetical protein